TEPQTALSTSASCAKTVLVPLAANSRYTRNIAIVFGTGIRSARRDYVNTHSPFGTVRIKLFYQSFSLQFLNDCIVNESIQVQLWPPGRYVRHAVQGLHNPLTSHVRHAFPGFSINVVSFRKNFSIIGFDVPCHCFHGELFVRLENLDALDIDLQETLHGASLVLEKVLADNYTLG